MTERREIDRSEMPALGYYLWMGHTRAAHIPDPDNIMRVAEHEYRLFAAATQDMPYEEETISYKSMVNLWRANKWKPLETAEAMTMIATWKLTS